MNVKGKIAIITGSTGKLGSKIALAIARAGADCVFHYNNNESLANELYEKAKSFGQKAITVGADLSNAEGIEKLFAASANFGVPAVLINSASIFKKQKLSDISFAQARETFDINLSSPIAISSCFATMVRAKGPGQTAKIINIADIAAERPWAQYCLYCASKAGLVAATKAMAKELAPDILVNAVSPGLIDLPETFDDKEKTHQVSMIPLARQGSAEDIVSAINFLIENDYVTGQVINIDGGRSI